MNNRIRIICGEDPYDVKVLLGEGDDALDLVKDPGLSSVVFKLGVEDLPEITLGTHALSFGVATGARKVEADAMNPKIHLSEGLLALIEAAGYEIFVKGQARVL